MRAAPTRAVLIGIVTALLAAPAAAQSRIGLGVMPIYDASGAGYGELLAPYLTRSIFERLRGEFEGLEPVFLNPGAAYVPMDRDAALEYAATAGVDAVMFGTLKPAERPKDDPRLLLEVTVVNLRDPTRTTARVVSTDVKRKDLERGFDEGRLIREFSPAAGGMTTVMLPSRRLSKQPLGKAGTRLAEQIHAGLAADTRRVVDVGTRPLPSAGSGPCDVTFSVRYVRQKTASKNYFLVVNDREESIGVLDGLARLRLQPGTAVIEVTVRDAPYRMPVQPEYMANTHVTCNRPGENLVLEIGPTGEGLLVWRREDSSGAGPLP